MISIYDLFEVDTNPEFNNKITCEDIKNKFVIQLHHAVRAGKHWDIRLEHDCVLKSWATKKLDDLLSNKSNKIALFQQPDHRPDWINFQGIIDDGYGKGKVEIWDTGNLETLKWKDHIIVIFHGKKIKGKYTLIPYKDKQWLFFKNKK